MEANASLTVTSVLQRADWSTIGISNDKTQVLLGYQLDLRYSPNGILLNPFRSLAGQQEFERKRTQVKWFTKAGSTQEAQPPPMLRSVSTGWDADRTLFNTIQDLNIIA